MSFFNFIIIFIIFLSLAYCYVLNVVGVFSFYIENSFSIPGVDLFFHFLILLIKLLFFTITRHTHTRINMLCSRLLRSSLAFVVFIFFSHSLVQFLLLEKSFLMENWIVLSVVPHGRIVVMLQTDTHTYAHNEWVLWRAASAKNTTMPVNGNSY